MSTSNRTRLLLVLVTALLPATAWAQAAPPAAQSAPPAVEREGFMIGFSLGGGTMSMEHCSAGETCEGSAFGFDLHLGGMLTPSLALMFEGHAATSSEEGGSLTQSSTMVAVQLFFASRFWGKLGLGFGQLSISDEDGDVIAESETGGAATVAFGVELMQSGGFALDLSLQGTAVSIDGGGASTGTLQLGFNWY